MKIAVFSTKQWVVNAFNAENADFGFDLHYLEAHLNEKTVSLAHGHTAVCVFVNDSLPADVVRSLGGLGVQAVALRCAGFNNVDIKEASARGLRVVRVPAYSPYAVAEHALGLIMSLNRRYHRAYNRVREGNFSIDGLLGFDIHGKTIGVVGTGKIGQVFCSILRGFGCSLCAYDPLPRPELAREIGFTYVPLTELYAQSDIISLHCPLNRSTHHLINDAAIACMKERVCIVNTSRGPLIDTEAVIRGLKSGKIGYLGLDVYEEEGDLFFEDLSETIIQDDTFVRLQTFPNVLITAHQAFFTKEAVHNIARTTLENLRAVSQGEASPNEVLPDKLVSR